MAEAGAAIAGHVAAHHTLLEARLEGLIDHTAVFEIADAPLEKLVARRLLRYVLGCRQHGNHGSVAGTSHPPALPDALAAITAVALDHARTRGEPRRQIDAHHLGSAIKGRVAAPAHATSTMEHLLSAHLEDHVGMGADPNAARRHLTQ